MPAIRVAASVIALCVLLLQACASPTPVEEPVAAEPVVQDPNDVPELTLNLPEQQDCSCTVDDPTDYTFLEKGVAALVAGDHIGAVQHFQRYQRLESSPQADWEADVAIAYDTMLARSPFYDPAAARKSYRRLAKARPQEVHPHDAVLLMWTSLETYVSMAKQLDLLRHDKAVLEENLEKREEAIQRLRELTLGQKGARP